MPSRAEGGEAERPRASLLAAKPAFSRLNEHLEGLAT